MSDSEASTKYVGTSQLRFEDETLLRGQGRFIDDLPVSRQTLHAAFVRSPHAHARIKSIDISAALKMPGVKAVVTGADIWPLTKPLMVGFTNPMDYRGIAKDKVRYVGEPIAVVCATDRYRAEDALAAVVIEYEVLDAVVDTIDAARDEAPVIHDEVGSNVVSRRVFTHGEPDTAFASAPHTSEMTIRYPRNSVTPMEGYAIVAEYTPDTGGYDVLSNFQGPFSVHTVTAIALNVPSSKLRHRSPANSGGSFGSKLTIFPYIVVLCICARLTGRPVKWIEDRYEHLASASTAPNRVTKVQAAYDDQGNVSALRLTHWDDHGAYLRAPMPAPIYRMHGLSTNGYKIRNVEVINHIMITNKCPTGAVRGFGGPQLYFAIERMIHKIATELGLDPLDVLTRNLISADSFPYRAPAGALIDSGNYQQVVADAVAQGGLAELKQRRDTARAEGRLYGIGYAATVEPSQSNMGYISTLKTAAEREKAGPKDGAVASCTISVDALGAVTVVGDSVPQGQGHQTTLAQIVADVLGLKPRDITVNLETDTQKDNWSLAAGNYSCRFAPASTSAAHEAATMVRNKMARLAGSQLNVSGEGLEFKDGWIQAKSNPENRLEFRRVGGLAHWSPSSLPEGMKPGIREVSYWNAPELSPTSAKDEINTSLAYGFGFDYCGVEINRDTGEVRIDRYVTAHDCGTILNPSLAEGQMRGSFSNAISAALYEEFAYSSDGAFKSGSFADYLIATAAEVPDPVLVHTVQTPSPYTRLGAKGIGEGNQYSTPVCLANAVADAIGREDIVLPLVPSRVFEWIHDEEAAPPQGAGKVLKETDGAVTGEGETFVPALPQIVWDALLDVDKMARIIPGCRSLRRLTPETFQGLIDLGVGPVRGTFDAAIKLSHMQPPNSVMIGGNLIGPLGASRGSGEVRFQAHEGGTRVIFSYSVNVSGTVAAVGGRMIAGAAKALINQFFMTLVDEALGEHKNAGGSGPVKSGFWSRLRGVLGEKN